MASGRVPYMTMMRLDAVNVPTPLLRPDNAAAKCKHWAEECLIAGKAEGSPDVT